jgi:hypothetical protein
LYLENWCLQVFAIFWGPFGLFLQLGVVTVPVRFWQCMSGERCWTLETWICLKQDLSAQLAFRTGNGLFSVSLSTSGTKATAHFASLMGFHVTVMVKAYDLGDSDFTHHKVRIFAFTDESEFLARW